jgi:hypothetical protein
MNRNQTLQDLLNTSVRHIRRQGKASMKGDSCAYRANDGSRCAAAPFITAYDPVMDKEELNFGVLAERYPSRLQPEALEEAGFVRWVLQAPHDHASKFGGGGFMPNYYGALVDQLEKFNRDNRTLVAIPPLVAMGALTY